MGRKKFRQVPGADFLFALDHHLHVQRQTFRGFEKGSNRGQVDEDPRLVIHDPASVETAVVAHARFKGRRFPVVQATGGLDIVMRVEEDRLRIGSGVQPLPDDIGVGSGDAQHLDPLKTRFANLYGDRFGRSLDLKGVESVRRHPGNPRELNKRIEGLRKILFDKAQDACGGRHVAENSTRRIFGFIVTI